jgi:hypothetical protein
MSEHRHSHPLPADAPHRPGEVRTPDAVQYDRDLNVRGVAWTAILLAIGTILALFLSWWIFLGLGKLEKASDPPPPALREVRERRLPPAPRLQDDPDGDMLKLRAQEDQQIARPSWIDEKQGTLRIPVDLAIDVLARRGLPAANGNPSVPAATPAPGQPAMPPTPTAPAPPTGSAQ